MATDTVTPHVASLQNLDDARRMLMDGDQDVITSLVTGQPIGQAPSVTADPAQQSEVISGKLQHLSDSARRVEKQWIGANVAANPTPVIQPPSPSTQPSAAAATSHWTMLGWVTEPSALKSKPLTQNEAIQAAMTDPNSRMTIPMAAAMLGVELPKPPSFTERISAYFEGAKARFAGGAKDADLSPTADTEWASAIPF